MTHRKALASVISPGCSRTASTQNRIKGRKSHISLKAALHFHLAAIAFFCDCTQLQILAFIWCPSLMGAFLLCLPTPLATWCWHWVKIFTAFENIYMQIHVNYVKEHRHCTSSGYCSPVSLRIRGSIVSMWTVLRLISSAKKGWFRFRFRRALPQAAELSGESVAIVGVSSNIFAPYFVAQHKTIPFGLKEYAVIPWSNGTVYLYTFTSLNLRTGFCNRYIKCHSTIKHCSFQQQGVTWHLGRL